MAKGNNNNNNNLYSTTNRCIHDDNPHHLSSDHPSLFKLSSNSSLRNESLHSVCISSQEFSTPKENNNHNNPQNNQNQQQQQQHRASDLSSVGQKVRMQQLLNAPAENDTDVETDPSKKASPNDTRSTNATTAYNDSHKNKNKDNDESSSIKPPKNDNDGHDDEILKRLGAASDSSDDNDDDNDLSRPMSFVSSLSSAASASGAHLILPDQYSDYQLLSGKYKPDKEHLWCDEERQRHHVAVGSDADAPSSLDAWALFHLVLRGESRDVVDCAHALKHGPSKRRKQRPGGFSQTPTPPPSSSNSSTVQPWQLSALRDLLDMHVQTLQTYHQLYQTVLLPTLAQRFRLPTKPNEHDVQHRELLRRIKQARDESLAPLLERLEVVADNESGSDKDDTSQTSEEDASFSNISTASLMSSLLAQLQAYKARLERHLRSQEDTTLVLMRAYCTPQHMQRLRLTRIWLAPALSSSGLLWGGLVHRVGLATFRMTVLEEQEHVPRAVWYVRFKPAWKTYVRDFVNVVHALKTGVRPVHLSSKSSSKSSSASSSSVASLSVLSMSVLPAATASGDQDDEEPTKNKVNGSNVVANEASAANTAQADQGGGVLLRSWKRQSSSGNDKNNSNNNDKGAAAADTTKAVPTRTAQVLRSWRRDNGSGGAIRSSSSLIRAGGGGAAKVVQC